ncbi:crosslink repair DNA glycosylase YcaQ family protein [Asanoa sp. WMMD1127]|uniref:DNA glycosylase AlkZ-like family protein n=1 Tax=Asanoa sp. WMMD1127 TaxID=3016107 RepID=UPI002417CA9C|nr:crosslink repair DNA glycosylase YcaQ family protein [Asanoa sp. WMMD1127]MDG4827566.1 crosslink repair DNA glycosylase YcaQ family protein [Asanoa sp. WMMD1127]
MADARLTDAQVRAHRVATHLGGGAGVLDTGIQDTPPGTTAAQALRLRVSSAPAGLALVHAARGAMHLHRAADLPLLAAALRPDDAADLRPQQFGPFFADLPLPIGAAVDEVAGAMAAVMADGVRRGKGELSTALLARVDERLRPWCPGCAAHHVQDALFRLASLPAGLRLVPNGDGSADFVAAAVPAGSSRDDARAELVRRFLRYAGPTDRDGLAAWLALSPAAARRWWELADVVPVEADGRWLFLHPADLDAARAVPKARGVHLLPPYDPILELGDRHLLVPDPVARKQVWRATANPGVVLADGAVAGTWRRRGKRITVTPFVALTATTRRALTGATDEEVVVAES